ncbi:20395_t:CDS:2 [Dentiscutata erythropus]|uniref:20395_t:CDS:1 n=1 Tax=Dentiscutata erythropus TaxID=1348616 RepID=A0A9N8VJ76_9GLOM|nr:20395_t:CDS:2 [Dentiscutata erythropus]
MASIRSVLIVAKAEFFNVSRTGAVRIKQPTTKLIPTRSLTIPAKLFQFSNAALIKPINSSFTRSVTTESTDNTINETNLKPSFPYNKHFTAWLEGVGMLRYSAIFEGMRWQDIINLNRYELTLMGVKDIESAWRLGSCFWIIKCDLAMKEGKKLQYWGGKDRYSPAFKDKSWREIIDMDYKDLKALGISSVDDRKAENPNDSEEISNTT